MTASLYCPPMRVAASDSWRSLRAAHGLRRCKKCDGDIERGLDRYREH